MYNKKSKTMNRKNLYWTALCLTMSLSFLSSCRSDDDELEEIVIPSEYIYVLNSGLMGYNNTTLTLYDVEEEKAATQCIFEAQNGRRLGDTGQDIIVYGEKIYIAMSGEATIEVTDLEAKSIRQIETAGEPRALAAHGGKVYVTYFNGYVARIDTGSLAVEETVAVGRNPEQLAVSGGKLFVANSGGLDFNTEVGYDKTVSVVDIERFREERKIDVVINPCDVVADNSGNVYVVSIGNYGDIPTVVQKMNATGTVSVVTDFNGTNITAAGNLLYALHSEFDENWNSTTTFYAYNMSNNTVSSDNFIGDTKIDNPFKISSDAVSGDIFITSSDYISAGDVYIFNKSHQFVNKFEAGLNPIKAVKVLR
jgi:YVTN family beta-propeller protein